MFRLGLGCFCLLSASVALSRGNSAHHAAAGLTSQPIEKNTETSQVKL